MIAWSEIPFDPPPRTLRRFAAIWLVVLSIAAAWQWAYRGRMAVGAGLMVAAVVVGLSGLVRPRSVRPVYVGLMVATFPIGWAVSQVVLGLIYGFVFTPIAVVFRLIGRDALERTRRPDLTSYWTPRRTETDPARYYRQF